MMMPLCQLKLQERAVHKQMLIGLQVEMSTRSTNRSFKKLITERDDVSPDDIYQALCNQNVDLVFTAHPTQVSARLLSILLHNQDI